MSKKNTTDHSHHHEQLLIKLDQLSQIAEVLTHNIQRIKHQLHPSPAQPRVTSTPPPSPEQPAAAWPKASTLLH